MFRNDVTNVELIMTSVGGYHTQVGRSIISDPDSADIKRDIIDRHGELSTSNFESVVGATSTLLSVDMERRNQRVVNLGDVEGLEHAGDWKDNRLLFSLSFTIPSSNPGHEKVYTYSGWCDGEILTGQDKPHPDTIYVVNDVNLVEKTKDNGYGTRVIKSKNNQLFINCDPNSNYLRPSDIMRSSELDGALNTGEIHNEIVDLDGIGARCMLSDRTNQNNVGYSEKFMLGTIAAKHRDENRSVSSIREQINEIDQHLSDDSNIRNLINAPTSGDRYCKEEEFTNDPLRKLLNQTGLEMSVVNGGRFTHLNLYDVFDERVLDNSTRICFDEMGELNIERPDSISWENGRNVSESDAVILEIATVVRNAVIGSMYELKMAQTKFMYSNTGVARDTRAELYGGYENNCIESMELPGLYLSTLMENPDNDIVEAEVKLKRKFMEEVVPTITKNLSRPLTVEVMIDRAREVVIEIEYDNYPRETITGTIFSDSLTSNMVTDSIHVKAGLAKDMAEIKDGISDNETYSGRGSNVDRGVSRRRTSSSHNEVTSVGKFGL